MDLNLNLPDFEQYTSDQQFVNVVEALEQVETQKGGLSPEEIWGMALQVVERLKKASRPDITAKRLLTQINSQTHNLHTTHCVLFCVNYLLCANDEEPDPNQDIIDNISRELSRMDDIVELFEAVEREEDREEAHGHKVKERNVMVGGKMVAQRGMMHKLEGDDQWIVIKLEELADHGLWLMGMTEADVKSGLRTALALETPGLNTKEMELSNKLWKMFRGRRGMDMRDSVRATWLNIVGYCLRHGMLKGASTQLCKDFYPDCGADDYKAINKGKNPWRDLKSFAEIEPLLDIYLKPKK